MYSGKRTIFALTYQTTRSSRTYKDAPIQRNGIVKMVFGILAFLLSLSLSLFLYFPFQSLLNAFGRQESDKSKTHESIVDEVFRIVVHIAHNCCIRTTGEYVLRLQCKWRWSMYYVESLQHCNIAIAFSFHKMFVIFVRTMFKRWNCL